MMSPPSVIITLTKIRTTPTAFKGVTVSLKIIAPASTAAGSSVEVRIATMPPGSADDEPTMHSTGITLITRPRARPPGRSSTSS